MSQVTIYSTPSCVYCKMAKEYFTNNKIEYNEINVADDPKAAEEMVSKSGQMGVPVIIVKHDDKEDLIVGFDQQKLAELLKIHQ